jgi:hypothetical protein
VLLYQETQSDNKNNAEMLDWGQRLSKFIEQRTKTLIDLKHKSDLYQQHLKEHEFCESKLVMAGEALEEGNLDANFFSNHL